MLYVPYGTTKHPTVLLYKLLSSYRTGNQQTVLVRSYRMVQSLEMILLQTMVIVSSLCLLATLMAIDNSIIPVIVNHACDSKSCH